MLSDVNGAKSLTSVKLSSLNIAKPRLTTEVFPDEDRFKSCSKSRSPCMAGKQVLCQYMGTYEALNVVVGDARGGER